MKHKLRALAVVAVGVTMLALPSIASAGTWKLDEPSNFTVHGNEGKITSTGSDPTITCNTVTGTGSYDATGETGSINIVFHECHVVAIFTFACTSPGRPAGTIAPTGTMPFHNIMIHSTAQVAGGRPGILMTPPTTNHFAEFTCAGNQMTVEGNGIIGEIEKPCGAKAISTGINFESTEPGHQKYKQITTAGTIYDQSISKNGGVTVTTSQDATTTFTFEKEGTITCP